MNPRVYIAGKISSRDFRQHLVPKLKWHRHEDGPLDCGTFEYVGPFFEACDHRCAHGPASHGVIGVPGYGCETFTRVPRSWVWQRNLRALRAATALFAYIESNDAFGTLVEIGWAQERGTYIRTLFGPGVDASEMWYAGMGGRRGRRAPISDVHRDELPRHFAEFLRSVPR